MRVALSNTHYQKRVEHSSLISIVPPLDLAYCAAVLRKRIPGIDLTLTDANALALGDDELACKIKAAKPDVLIVTAATHSINSAKRVIEAAKSAGAATILIGTHGSALPEKTLLEIPDLDVVVRGEPELTVAESMIALADKKPLAGVAGIAFRKDGEMVATPDRPPLKDLDSLPFPARDLLPNELYRSPFSDHVTALQTTRGCPGRCTFCDSHVLYGRVVRTRDPKKIAEEMALCADRYGVDYFAIMDHTFTADRSFVHAFCEEIVGLDLHRRIRWVCNTRVDMLDDKTLDLMKKAGCLQIGVGIESAVNHRLEAAAKGVDQQQIRTAVERIKRRKIIAMGYAIIGFPDDDRSSIAATEQAIIDLNPDTLQLSFATPLPGSALYEKCLQEGRILSDRWDDYVFLRKSVIKNDSFSSAELESLRLRILRRFYFRPRKIAALFILLFFGSGAGKRSLARAAMQILKRLIP